MKQRTAASMTVAAILLVVQARAEDNYTADKSHAYIGFSISHMVISKVKGNFDAFEASLSLEDGKLTDAKATIQVDSIDTDNVKRDKHLKSADFFDAEQFPEIKFETKTIEAKNGTGVITGNLTLHGVTKQVSLPYTVKGPVIDPWGNTKLGFEATTTIDRTEFGLKWSQALETGGLVVGNEVDISIDVEFAKQ